MKLSNEEHIRVIKIRDEEVKFLQKDVQAWKEIIDKGGDEVLSLKRMITELEEKNKKLNEKLNEVIYNKASAYK